MIENSLTINFKGIDDIMLSSVRDMLREVMQHESAEEYGRSLNRELDKVRLELRDAYDQCHKMDDGFRFMRALIAEIVRDHRLIGELKPDALTKLAVIDAIILKRDVDEIPF